MTGRRAVVVGLAVALLGACSSDPSTSDGDSSVPVTTVPPVPTDSAPPATLLSFSGDQTSAFVIDPPGTGNCEFDNRSRISLLDPATGSVLWERSTPWWSERGIASDGTLVWQLFGGVGDRYGVVALDVATGAPVWQRFLDDPGYRLTLTTASLVVTVPKGLIALEPSTGEELWYRTAAGFRGLSAGQATDVFGEAALTDTVYVNDAGSIVALDAATGDERWTRSTSGDWSFAPNVTDGTVWHVAFEGQVYSLDAAAGSLNWTWKSEPGVGLGQIVAISDDVVVVPTVALYSSDATAGLRQLIGLDRATGAVRWSVEVDDGYGPVIAADGAGLLLHPGSSEPGDLTAVDLDTGATVWTATDDAIGYAGTWLDNSPIVAALQGPELAVAGLDPTTGQRLWTVTGFGTSLAALDDGVLVGTASGTGADMASRSGELTLVNGSDGAVRWVTGFDEPPAQTLITAGGLLVWSRDLPIFCD